jgi:hypothetical protein
MYPLQPPPSAGAKLPGVDHPCVLTDRRGNITSYTVSLLKFDGRRDPSMKTLRWLIGPGAPHLSVSLSLSLSRSVRAASLVSWRLIERHDDPVRVVHVGFVRVDEIISASFLLPLFFLFFKLERERGRNFSAPAVLSASPSPAW